MHERPLLLHFIFALSERASEHLVIFFISFDASWIDKMDNSNCCFLSSWLVITSWLDGWIGSRSFLISVHSSKMHILDPNNLSDLNVIVIYDFYGEVSTSKV